jgi:3-oxoacyl-ACP reductase-like protein
MSIFSAIKNAIFGKPAQAAEAPAAAPVAAVEAAPVYTPEPVDVDAVCSAMPGAANLNWRSSIVDLMKLLGIDSSYANRKDLANELGNASYSGSAEDNIALHKLVMNELANNGGKVPAELLD